MLKLFFVLGLLFGGGWIHLEEEETVPDPVPVSAGSMILMDAGSGTILLDKNAEGHFDPAGLTKMMGSYIAAESLSPDQYLVMSDSAFSTYDHSTGVLWIDTGEAIEAEGLIHACLLQSANDTMAMLAEGVSGDNAAFLALMNHTAEELSMPDTHYSNIFGLNAEDHYTSASDTALLLREALKNPLFAEAFRAQRYSIAPTAKQEYARTLVSDCELYGYSGDVGCQVGRSSWDGWSAAAVVKREDTEFIVVIMGDETKDALYADLRSVLDYGFSHYRTVSVHHEDIEEKRVSVKRMGLETAEVIFRCDQDFSVLMNTGEASPELSAVIEVLNPKVSEPEEMNGRVVFFLNGEQVAEVPAVREILYDSSAYSSRTRQYFDYFCILVLGGLILKNMMKYLSADHGA